MAVFMLETDSVTSAATSLDSLATQVSDLASSVSGYDTSCDDGDLSSAFSSAKGVISGNLDACSTKIKNTSAVLNNVVSSHTSLQNSLKFQSSEEKAAAAAAGSKSPSPVSGGGGGGGYSGGGGGGGGYSGGGGYRRVKEKETEKEKDKDKEKEKEGKEKERKPVDVDAKIGEILHSKVDTKLLTDVGKELFESKGLVYNGAGYATIGGMFIIACSKEYGNVGDEIEITLKDGQKFKCIIGQIDDSTKGKLKFFVNDKWKEDGEENFQKEIGDYVNKIQNLGANVQYTVGTTVNSAVEWANKTAKDDSHGYSRETRWGNPNYDCSSFVISAYEAAGIKVKEAGASYTGNMRKAFEKVGFKWIPGTPDVNNLKPGDVLLNEGTHAEMYFGDGKMIGAHGNSDGRDGDSGKNEICITKYSNKNWDGVLRYVGKDTSTSPSSSEVPKAPHVKIESKDTSSGTTTDSSTDTSQNNNTQQENNSNNDAQQNTNDTTQQENTTDTKEPDNTENDGTINNDSTAVMV